MEEIRSIIEAETAGDPMSERRWTHQTAARVAECLVQELEIKVSATVVRRLLGELDYSLKSNKKCLSAGNSPDRDTQFGIIKRLREEFLETGDPIISVDTKKKELIGLFKNSGRTWRREARKVKDHDFRSEAEGMASPYGIYDIQRNFGVLVVGESADTPEFAVNSILTWWHKHGQEHYPKAKRLLILADGGGSNGARPRMWKRLLQETFADEHTMTITVAHYPTGASKWNPIEHRMFSEISKNWAGEPLESFETVINFARDTSTQTGLRIEAYRDQRDYEKGRKVSDKEMDKFAIIKGDELGKWNYTIQPRAPRGSTQSEPNPKPHRPILHHPSPAKSTKTIPYSRDLEPLNQRSNGTSLENRPAYTHSSDKSSSSDDPHTIVGANQGSSSRSFSFSHLITGFRRLLFSYFC